MKGLTFGTIIALALWAGIFWVVGMAFAQDNQQYQEPSTNADLTPLLDLKQCTITVTDVFSGTTGHQVFSASSPAGGAIVDFSVSSILGGILEGDYDLIGICSDLKGSVSVVSNTKTATFPSVPPSAPVLQ